MATKSKLKSGAPPRGIGFWLGLNLLFCALSLLSYGSCLLKPSDFGFAGFFTFSVPIFIIFNFLFVFYWLFVKPVAALFSAVILVLGWKFVVATFGWSFSSDPEGGDFKVLSYNVNTFKGFGAKADLSGKTGRKMINWLLHADADILCLQEFYNQPGSDDFNAAKKLKAVGYKHHFFSRALRTGWNASLGMATFSRFPIVHSEIVRKTPKSNNQILLTDIKLPSGTIRVLNVHLQSNFLKESEIEESKQGENVSVNVKSIWRKLTNGYTVRNDQAQLLLQTISNSPHPVLLAGDLNETPYSYTYHQLNQVLDNSFEKAGSGFGFTYNGYIPFLRIDNLFADRQFEVRIFETHNHVPYSDHFPVSAAYKRKK
jgi:endonuclease/exonuclease/phosphatase family metal-dependent hydrolase